jgi:hypothetical protein
MALYLEFKFITIFDKTIKIKKYKTGKITERNLPISYLSNGITTQAARYETIITSHTFKILLF